ncbi:hypothetical protein E2562_002037 [Oryza meyeriana var. granulata]|uniref:Uncharacterized protein n=1 Tax=Oryza meyeriana var. granulata TaxID=110450 RepID=A0A6G1EFQ9_9ORYZ|nr:hypothetical protein E2562_002037 [Oryza meyeriana var. granulata]
MPATAPSPASVRAAASSARSRSRSSAGRVAALPADGRGDGVSTAAAYKELGESLRFPIWMYKLLKGPYDKEGACVIVTAGSEGVASEAR